MTSDLFQQLILKHYRSSRHRGQMEMPFLEAARVNPVCGDQVSVRVRIEGNSIEQVRFTGQGCSISQAAASMISQQVEGKTLEEARAIGARFREMLRGDAGASSHPALGDLRALAGVGKLPQRVRCAMLAWGALEEVIEGPETGAPAS